MTHHGCDAPEKRRGVFRTFRADGTKVGSPFGLQEWGRYTGF